jgi:hypothetical protein
VRELGGGIGDRKAGRCAVSMLRASLAMDADFEQRPVLERIADIDLIAAAALRVVLARNRGNSGVGRDRRNRWVR